MCRIGNIFRARGRAGSAAFWLGLALAGGGASSGLAQPPIEYLTTGAFGFSAASYPAAESEGFLRLTVVRRDGTKGQVLVDLVFEDDTAVLGTDYAPYLPANNTVFFEDFQTSADVYVLIFDNGDINTNGLRFRVSLDNPRPAREQDADTVIPSLGNPATATVNILDNERGFNFTRRWYSTRETNNPPQVTIGVSMREPREQNVTVEYRILRTINEGANTFALAAGSDYAAPDVDFTVVSGTLTFTPNPAGQVQTFTVPIHDDGRLEFNEDFRLEIRNPNGQVGIGSEKRDVALGPVSAANCTILFDDRHVLLSDGAARWVLGPERPAGAVDIGWNPDDQPFSIPEYNLTPGANAAVNALVVQPDGMSLLVGDFTSMNTLAMNRIARLTTNGWIDETFTIGTGADEFIQSLALYGEGTNNGKIIIVGGFSSFNGTQRNGVARLNANGTLDTTFNPGTGANAPVRAVALQADQRILIGGDFTTVNGVSRPGVARLMPDGALDTTFNPGTGANGIVWAIAAGSGGIVLGGEFTRFNNESFSRLVRLTDGGQVDESFNPGSGANDVVYALALQPDGRLLAGGAFTRMDQRGRNGIARLNADGSLDVSFDPGSGADNTVFALRLQADGNILVGGAFRLYNDLRRPSLARIYAHGPVDTSFLDTAFNQFAGTMDDTNKVYAVDYQANGFVIIGGDFTRVGGGFTRADWHPRYYAARLIGGYTPQSPGNLELVRNEYRVEENAGTFYAAVMRTNGWLSQAFVEGAMTNGLALDGLDYLNLPLLASWPTYWPSSPATDPGWQIEDGSTNTLLFVPAFTIPILDDTLVEGDEEFTLSLVPPFISMALGGDPIPIGVALGRRTSIVTIADNDFNTGLFQFAEPSYMVEEGRRMVEVSVIRVNGSSQKVSVDYDVVDGISPNPALAGQDYTFKRGTLDFAAGQTNRTITIDITDDGTVEPDEDFLVRIFNPKNARMGDPTNTVVIIVDNDYAPGRLTFVSTNYTVNENAGLATINVRRLGGNAGAVSVDYRTRDGTASNGLDYTFVTGTLTWNDGDIADKTFTVPILDDDLVEPDETVFLALTNFQGALPGAQTNATLTIINDDAYGRLQFSTASYFADENGGLVAITVVRRDGVAGPVSVQFRTQDLPVGPGSARAGQDYVATNGTLNFASGQVSATFQVRLLDDTLTEGNEDLQLVLSNPAGGATLGPVSTATLTIVDDESVNIPAGSLDTSFDPTAGANGFINALALQTNGALLLAGNFTQVNGLSRPGVGRLTADGTLDPNFNPGLGISGQVRTMLLQDDGRVLLGGSFSRYDRTNRNNIVRINSDGSLDRSFNPGSGADNPVNALAIQTIQGQRRIVLGGVFTTVGGISRNSIARLNDDGAVDLTFKPGLGASGPVNALAVQADGKLLVGGDFIFFNGQPHKSLVRLNVDGSLDPTFSAGEGPNGSIRALAVQTDGKILIAGAFTTYQSVPLRGVARLNSNGTVDPSFNADGLGANGTALALALQVDGRILVGGEFTTFNGVTRRRLTRLNPDGSVDPTINFGTGANSFIGAVVVQPDRKIVIGGGFTIFNEEPRNYLARLHGGALAGPGRIDFTAPAFTVDETGVNASITVRRTGGTTGDVSVEFETSDGTATAGADYLGVTNTLFFPQGETLVTVTISILNDNLVEPDETVTLRVFTNDSSGVALGPQPFATLTIRNDDSLVTFSSPTYSVTENFVTGNATISVTRTGAVAGGVSVDYVTLTNLGTATPFLDYTPVSGRLIFGPGETLKTFNVPIIDDDLLEDSETVVFALTNLVGQAQLAASPLTVLTIIDNDFRPGTLTFSAISYRVSETNGTITLNVYRTNGFTGTVSARYFTADGSATTGLDYLGGGGLLTFTEGVTNQSITIRILNDTLVEGNETFYVGLTNLSGGTTVAGPAIVPVNIEDDDVPAGDVDPAFDPGLGANNFLRTLLVQPDGRLLIGGAFTTFDGINRGRVARLESNGQLDLTFDPGDGANALVNSIARRRDGRVVLAGNFSSFAGLAFNRLTLLAENGAPERNLWASTFDAAVSSVALTAGQDEVLAGGAFTLPTRGITRLLANGGVDISFNPGSGFNGPVHALVALPNGQTLAAGGFSSLNGMPRGRLARLNADGTPDLGFAPTAITNGSLFCLAVQPNGQVLVGGDFQTFGSTSRVSVARFNTDGSLDTGFYLGAINGAVFGIGQQTTGRILIGGSFTTVNGLRRNRIARLGQTGLLDTDFEPGLGVNGTVYALAVLPDDNVVIAGDFSLVNGIPRNGIARLLANDPPVYLSGIVYEYDQAEVTVVTRAGQTFVLEGSKDFSVWMPISTNTSMTGILTVVDPYAASFKHRFYRARTLGP